MHYLSICLRAVRRLLNSYCWAREHDANTVVTSNSSSCSDYAIQVDLRSFGKSDEDIQLYVTDRHQQNSTLDRDKGQKG